MPIKTKSLKVNAVLNGIKQICGIIFPVLTFSYASKIVGAEGIGIFSFVQSIINYMALIATIGISHYAVRDGAKVRDDKNKLQAFCNQIFSINLLFTFFAYFLLVILFIIWDRLHEYSYALLIQSSVIIIATLGADWINAIFEDYFYLTIRYIVVQTLALISMVCFVNSPEDLYTYIVICTFALAGGNAFNFFYVRKRIKLTFTWHMNFNKHIVPLLFLFFNSIASIIYLNSDITMLRIFTNNIEVGIYAFSIKIYAASKTLINALTYVTVPRFSYYLGNNLFDEYNAKFNKLLNYLVILCVPMAIGMFAQAENMLLFLTNSNFIKGVSVIKILALAFPFAVGACFYAYAVLIPNNLEKYFMYSTVLAAIVNICLNFFLIPKFGMNGAALTTVFAEATVFLLTFYYSRKCVVYSFKINRYISIILGSIAILPICYVVSNLIDSRLWIVIVSIIVSTVVFSLILLIFKNPEALETMDFLKRCFEKKVDGDRHSS